MDRLVTTLRTLGHLRVLSVDRLYAHTREHTADLRPWMCDARGVAVVLDARYEFIDMYVGDRRAIGLEEIRRTDYWKFVSAPLDQRPRDGGRTWQYADPEAQAKRFMRLIDSVLRYGYVVRKRSALLDEFEREAPLHVETDGEGVEKPVDYTGRSFAGLISVVRHGEYYSAWNGLHRLAILKRFRDGGAIRRDRILTIRIG